MAERMLLGDTLAEAEAHARALGFARNDVYRARLFLRALEEEK